MRDDHLVQCALLHNPRRRRRSEYLLTISVAVAALHDVGTVPLGRRYIDMLGAGTFEGPHLKGEVLAGGLDMKTLRSDGALNPDVRLESFRFSWKRILRF
jgi:hypothetical protein